MNRRVLFALIVSIFLALGFTGAFSQTGSSSGFASLSVSNTYRITNFGFGVLNDSFTFVNNGTSSVQIPVLHVGIPTSLASLSSNLVVSPLGQFSMSESSSNGSEVLTITPNTATLGAGANETASVKAITDNIFNLTSTGGLFNETASDPVLVLLSPSVDRNVTSMTSSIILPTGAYFRSAIPGFSLPAKNATNPTFVSTHSNVQPSASAQYLNMNASVTSTFTPLKVTSLVRTVVPSENGVPMVLDQFSLENVADFNINTVQLYPLNTFLPGVTLVPDTIPPLVNPQTLSLNSGILSFAGTTLKGPLIFGSNITLEISYPLPSSMVKVSGSSVALTLPTTPLVAAPFSNYTIKIAPAKGIVETGQTAFNNVTYSPFGSGSVNFAYSLAFGWASGDAIPAGALVFAIAFAMFAVQRPGREKEMEEEGKVVRRTSDVLKALEEKTGLETQYVEELGAAAKGSIPKTTFDRMRNEINDLRNRALQRLNEMKQSLGSGKQYDLLVQVTEAEKEEDRAFRDLLNLYFQYHGNRMNQETFKRLQPNYKKRVESAVNHLSDLLHQVQTEEK